ncbi:MAG: hypothetical protein ABI548_17050 [Polyangiaceae bacterium]
MNRTLRVVATSVAVVGVAGSAFLAGRVWAAGVPATGALTYSGLLQDAAGAPLTGSHPIEVQFWSAPSAGTSLCDVKAASATLTNGRFSLPLTDDCVTGIHANSSAYVEVSVDGVPLGRTKLGAVPYALEAGHATSADSAGTASGMLVQQLVPSGAVMAYNLPACPAGWVALPAAGGRTIVGVNPAGGNGLSQRSLGATVGEETHTMSVAELAPHTHSEHVANANGYTGIDGLPAGSGLEGDTHFTTFNTGATGTGVPFNNMQPSIAFLYCQKS